MRLAVALIPVLMAMTTPSAAAAAAQARSAQREPAPIAYTLRFPAPHTHYIEVEAEVPTSGRPAVDLAMAVWTPGSYLVREFSRHVEDVRAEAGGQPCAVTKTAKNRWRVETGRAPSVHVRYRVYAREMTVRTNFVDAGFALINGAATFITLADETAARPHDVRLDLPAAWKTSVSALPSPAGQAHRYRAADFDTLVDSPIVAGNPALYEFSVGGVPHVLVNVGEDGVWDGPRSAADAQKIVEAHAAFWGGLPYERYVIFNVISEGSGGLEHAGSAVLMTSRWRTRTRKGYVDWLSLVSHELFHAWNVKRLRPVELGPFAYERENYTRSLWAAEGLTSYYGDLLAVRAGVLTRDEYLSELASMVAELQSTPGRLSQSVEDASFDAWIRYYRQDENTPNTTISYYTKGAVIGFVLDLQIRRATGNARSLDDVMRLAYKKFSGASGFTTSEFRALVSEVAGTDLSAWLHRALETTEELDYAGVEWLGLHFRPDGAPTGRAWLGLSLTRPGATLRDDGGRLVVSQVRRGTPAHEAGVNVDDEILALEGFRVRPDTWAARLEAFRQGDTLELLVARREKLLTVEVTAQPEPARERLAFDPSADAAAEARQQEWLTGKRTPGAGETGR